MILLIIQFVTIKLKQTIRNKIVNKFGYFFFFLNKRSQIDSLETEKELKKCPPVYVKKYHYITKLKQGTKLSVQFSLKGKTKFEHLYDLVYSMKCLCVNCKETQEKLKEELLNT